MIKTLSYFLVAFFAPRFAAFLGAFLAVAFLAVAFLAPAFLAVLLAGLAALRFVGIIKWFWLTKKIVVDESNSLQG